MARRPALTRLELGSSRQLDMQCRVCGERHVEEILDLGDQPHCNSLLRPEDLEFPEATYPLRFGVCASCKTAQIDFTVPKERLFSDYVYVSGTTRALRLHFRKSVARLRKSVGLTAGDLVVDIGSNDGTWLREFQSAGFTGLGIEPATNLARVAEADGIPTLNRFFDADAAATILEEAGVPRLVTAAGVFFHLEELHSATRGVAELCRRGAVFCVQAIYLGAMLRQTAFDQIYHEHLTYWTLGSLEHLLALHGLEVFSAAMLPIHGGSLEVLAATKGSVAVDASVQRLRKREAGEGLHDLQTYRAFASRVWELGDRLRAILNDYVSKGQVIHAFGAPAKGATLLNSFQLGPDLIQLAVERNPLKIGLTIPGVRIPIVKEDSVPEPDAYLMLPWNFLDEFFQSKRAYLEQGGAFIVPIPQPRVIRNG